MLSNPPCRGCTPYSLQRASSLPVYRSEAAAGGGGQHDRLLECGTTCTLAILQGDAIAVAHVGDSAAVLVRCAATAAAWSSGCCWACPPPPALPCLGLPSPSAHTWLVSLLLASHSPAFALAPFIHSLDTPTSNARPVCLLNLHLILVLHPTCSLREDDTVEARFITVDHNGRNVSEADRIDKSHARTTRCLSASSPNPTP